ncbi:MAG: type II toxin-antitoxin system VapC family toxin, partial [Candidatus Poribacteria bacterium]|nr:type II toxin-antitoxin system VapC family toxin [Candidatus Poribacteria bacterium]
DQRGFLHFFLHPKSTNCVEITDRSLDIRVQTNLQPLRIYLDTCCLSRPFDDQTQARIRQETEVIGRIMLQFRAEHWDWISSEVLIDEVERISDLNQRLQIKDWLTEAYQTVSIRTSEISRGKHLETLKFKEDDALHLACAESASVDIFLTTDDKFLRRAKCYNVRLRVRVENPYIWFQEMVGNERIRNDR